VRVDPDGASLGSGTSDFKACALLSQDAGASCCRTDCGSAFGVVNPVVQEEEVA
jgi:hypothetical protein